MTKPLSRLKILQGAVGIYLVVYVVLGTLLDDPLLFSKMTPKRLDEALHKFNEPYGPAASTSHDIWTSNSCFSEMIKARHLTDYLWCKPVRLLTATTKTSGLGYIYILERMATHFSSKWACKEALFS